jgi:hypothetical protein
VKVEELFQVCLPLSPLSSPFLLPFPLSASFCLLPPPSFFHLPLLLSSPLLSPPLPPLNSVN